MQELTPEQSATLRRLRGKVGAKELARRLKVPPAQVERALATFADEEAVAREPRWWIALGVALVLLAGTLSYGANHRYGFHFDDSHALQHNAAIRTLGERTAALARPDDSGLDRLRNFRRALGPTAQAIYEFNLYRMVTYWSMALNHWAHGLTEAPPPGEATHASDDPFTAVPHWGWHATNNAIHYLNGLLVFWVAYLTLTAPVFRRGGRAPPLAVPTALLAAVVFVAHPMQTQAVTYLTQRTESLCALFYLLCLGLYITARCRALSGPRGTAPYWTAALLGAAGLSVAVLAALARIGPLGLTGFLTLAGLVLIGTAAGVVALVKTGRDERGHAALTVGAFAAFALALETKEIAATIPFAIVAWDLLFVPGGRAASGAAASAARGGPWLVRALRGSGRERLQALGPWAAIVAAVALLLPVFGGLAFAGQLLAEGIDEGGGTGAKLNWFGYLLTQANVLHTYLRQFVLPYGLHLDHAYPAAFSSPLSGLTTALSVASILGALGLVVGWGGRARVPAFALLFGLAVLAPTSSFVVLPDVIYEHRFYLPLAGAALVVAVLARRAATHVLPAARRAPALLGLAAAVALGLGLATRARNQVWENEVTLWLDVTSKSPTKPRAWTNLGLAYQSQEPARVDVVNGGHTWGQVRDLPGGLALVQPTTILQRLPEPLLFRRDQLRVVPRAGGFELASEAYREALKIDPEYSKALNNLALVTIYRRQRLAEELELVEGLKERFRAEGRAEVVAACRERLAAGAEELVALFDAAEEAFLRQVALGEANPILFSNLGNLYWTVGRPAEAIEWIDRALPLRDCPPETWAVTGDIRHTQGVTAWREGARAEATPFWEDARRRYDSYLRLSPRGTHVEHVRGMRARVAAFLAGERTPTAADATAPFAGGGAPAEPPEGP